MSIISLCVLFLCIRSVIIDLASLGEKYLRYHFSGNFLCENDLFGIFRILLNCIPLISAHSVSVGYLDQLFPVAMQSLVCSFFSIYGI